MPKLLVFTSVYPPPFIGGAERSINSIYTSIQGEDFDILVCALDANEASESILTLAPKLSVFRTPFKFIPHPVIESFKTTKLSKTIFHISNLGFGLHWMTVFKQIRIFKPDVIITHNLTGWGYAPWIFGNLFNIPIVHDNRDYYLTCSKTTRWREFEEDCGKTCITCKPREIASKIFWREGTQISNSNFVDQYVRRVFDGNKRTKYEVIYPPISLNNNLENGYEPIYDVGFIGRIEKSKGVEQVLASLSGKGVSLAIAGEGSLKDSLEKKYLDVRFLGQIPSEVFLSKIRVLAVPSLWAEPFGRVIVEAVNFGIPVIAGKKGGMLENKIRPGAVIIEIDPKNLIEILEASKLALSAGRNIIPSTEEWRKRQGIFQIKKFRSIVWKIAEEGKK